MIWQDVVLAGVGLCIFGPTIVGGFIVVLAGVFGVGSHMGDGLSGFGQRRRLNKQLKDLAAQDDNN